MILLWTEENFCLLAQLLPISWSFSSKDIDQSGTQIVIPRECHGHIMERLIPAPSLTVSSCLHYSRDVVEVLHCSFTTFCLPSTPSSFAAPLPLVTGGDSRRCRYSYISIYPFLMASCFPELEPSYSGSVGPVMLSGLVATLCNLRARVCDLGSALTAIPGGRAMSISSGPQMKKKKKKGLSLRWPLLGKYLRRLA